MKIAIVGAGIGGLTTALACHEAGFDVVVHEKVAEPREVGAGVQVSPNGAKVLHRLGLEESLEPVACLPERAELRLARTGALVLSTPLGATIQRRYGAPWYNLHRADLHDILFQAVRQRCGADAVHTGHDLVTYGNDGGVTLHFANGDVDSADVLVGADGLHSVTRRVLLGEDKAVFTGHVAWRGLVPAAAVRSLGLDTVVTSWMAPRSHAVTYFVKAGEFVNFVGIKEQGGHPGESWTETGDTRALLADIEDWHPTVRRIASLIEKPLRWGLYAREPLARWTGGRVALLGDACHPMLPYMAQGAVMAIEDAWVLATCLKRLNDIEAALGLYQNMRLARTARVQRIARANGELFHLSGAAKRLAVYGAMALGSRVAPGLVTARHDWILRYDATML